MNRPNLALYFVSILLLALVVFSSADAVAYEKKSYYIDDPVFGGQSYIVEAGRNNKELVVLVHGLGDVASDTWTAFIPQLAENYHVLTFDLPGFGRSSKSNQLYSPENYVAFINYVVRQSGHEHFMLVGHSMGGNIALRYASIYPDKVKRLMLIDAAGVLHRLTYGTFFTHFGIQLVPEFYPQQNNDIRSIAGLVLGELARQHNLLEAGEKMILNDPLLRQKVFAGNPSVIAAYAMIMEDYSSLLSSMKVPTFILWGENDIVIPLRTGKVLATNLPNAGLVVLSNTGHVPMDDKPLIFSNWLRRFVSSDEQTFQAMLKQTRYRLGHSLQNTSQRIASCKNNSGKTFRGDYRLITIDNCRNVNIESARIQSLTVRNSQVVLSNCLIKSPGKTFLVEDSDVQINGCTISGSPAIEFKRSELDIAGTHISSSLSSGGVALRNAEKPVTAPASGSLRPIQNGTTLIFSVSSITSKYHEKKKLHGPVIFKPGQAW